MTDITRIDTVRAPRPDNRALNATRAVAAVLVVAEHVRALLFRDWSEVPHSTPGALFYFATGLGQSAVLVFFVLSGFWVGGSVVRSVSRGTFSWSGYALRRGVRLWVVLLPASVIAVAIGWFIVTVLPGSGVAQGDPALHVVPHDLRSSVDAATWFGNVLFLQGIAVPVIGTDGPLWSLAYEFWYYVLFPLVALTVTRRSPRVRLLCAGLAVLVALLVGPAVLRLFPIWALGALVALLEPRIRAVSDRSPRLARLAAGTSLVLLMAAVAAREVAFSSSPIGDYLVGLATAAFIASLLRDAPMRGPAWAPIRGAARYAGSSYSLYVIHLPVALVLSAVLLPRAEDRFAFGLVGSMIFLAALGLLLVVGWFYAAAFEHRTDALRGWIERRLQSGRPTPTTAPAN